MTSLDKFETELRGLLDTLLAEHGEQEAFSLVEHCLFKSNYPSLNDGWQDDEDQDLANGSYVSSG